MAESLSQNLNLTSNNGPISMALAKLSYCTTSTYQKRLQWEHLHNRNGMFVVFDIARQKEARGTVTEDRVIKLIVGSRLMEQISMNNLLYQVRLDRDSNRSSQHSDENLRVRIIVKKPLMAIRYRLADDQVRRIQMNFHLESGFHLAKEILKSHNLPIQDQDLILDQPLQSTSTQSSYSAGTPSFGSQPSTSSDVTPGLPPSGAVDPAWASMSLRPPPTSYSETHVTQQSQFVYPNQDESSGFLPPRSVMNNASGIGTGFVPNVHQGGSNLSNAVNCGQLESDLYSSSIAQVRGNITLGPSVSRRFPESDAIRPASAPATQSERLLTETFPLSQMLPPRRVLPFPENKQTESHATCAKEVTEKKQTVQKERKNAEDVKTENPKKPAARPKAPKAPRARPASRAATSKPPAKKATSAQTTKTATLQEKNEEGPIPKDPLTAPIAPKTQSREVSPSRSEDLRHISEPRHELPPTAAESSAVQDLANVPTEKKNRGQEKARAPPCSTPTLENLQPEEYLTSLDSWIRKYHNMPAPLPPQTSKDLLAEYASQSDEDRTKAIDNLICECLEDDNFIKLAKDVEGAWMRIGLGF